MEENYRLEVVGWRGGEWSLWYVVLPLHFCSTKSQPYVITVVFKFLCRCNGYRGLRVVWIGVQSLAYGVLEQHAPALIHLNGRAAIPKASRWRPF